ncbi:MULTISPECIES: YHS domain-containing protein [Thermomonospora]|uniref:propane 2-monooxygenase n=1 Tax=Thermomonospora curvata (strain ATCC 19995 / DSM 43183 / JCM 3096 / KCTC 9072 / NBRC 15933 / NCIMB 10081 / Henssen B9) TaxID=471852 RepID=D1A3J8_THECD|nr:MULTISPECIES: YHS domain-containing protein [Thermomonospora]ACY96123.1 methane/phenol/toluene hydroxylase [Thermomonospora curvata DSM 43183]PKK15978.1 MAG: phenol 2-monooxygenase [Thermomonospora sp. CIF 1]
MAKRLPLKQRYAALTRDVHWEPTYVPAEEVFPYTRFEGIKIHDWSQWEDPFRLTVDAYHKYQAEKDRRLYAVLDGFAQSQGHLSLSDARYLNSMKLFLQGVTPLEYQAHRHFAFLARYLDGAGPRFAALCQSIDELRHAQTQIHTLSGYNRYYSGFHSFAKMHDRVWYLSVPKSFFDDALSAGPFEFLIAISFSFEYLLTNLLFVPFMSGASFNGDLPSMTFGFSAQSDESRHMTLGLEAIKFLLEQDEGNVPIIQDWIDKWFWRGYRLASLVAAMMDYMLPRKVMSWKEAFELYFEEQMLGGLFPDLAYYGIQPPRHVGQAVEEKELISHQVYWVLYQFSFAAAFTTTVPEPEEMRWLSEQYPKTFDRYYAPLWERARKIQQEGGRFFFQGLPQLCQVCQIPMTFTEPGDPTRICQRHSIYRGERFDFCSDGCKWIFDREPEKYVQAWLPVHQIHQGNCGGPTVPEVLEWYGITDGDNGEYLGSRDHDNWLRWHATAGAKG